MMPVSVFRPKLSPREITGDNLNASNKEIERVIKDIQSVPFLSGVAVDANLAIGTTTINHGLNRDPQGWIITDHTSAAATVFRAAWTDKTISLTASAACVLRLWVF